MTNARMSLTKPVRATAADQVAEALFEAILAGTVEPGSPLRLQDLANELGTSMMPVREAVRRLESLGLVEIVPHKGAWVRPLTRADLLDTYFTRTNLEALAIREAAGRFTEENARQARAALDEQQRAREQGDQVRARSAHERFHFALYEACGSGWLMRSILPAWRNSERYRVESMRHVEGRDERHNEHHKILAALERRDAEEAVACLMRHLQTSIDLVFAALPDGADAAAKPDDLASEFLRLQADPAS